MVRLGAEEPDLDPFDTVAVIQKTESSDRSGPEATTDAAAGLISFEDNTAT